MQALREGQEVEGDGQGILAVHGCFAGVDALRRQAQSFSQRLDVPVHGHEGGGGWYERFATVEERKGRRRKAGKRESFLPSCEAKLRVPVRTSGVLRLHLVKGFANLEVAVQVRC